MLQSKDFTAWISIDGVPVPEYGLEISAAAQPQVPEEISCYIPSEVGKQFSVHWSNVSAPGLTGGGVQVDGHKCGFEAIAAETRPFEAYMDGIAETGTSTRPFLFAPMELTDDDMFLDSASHPNLGLIKLEIWPVATGGGYMPSVVAVPSTQKVHEKTKKGSMNQQIGFGASLKHAPIQSTQIRRIGLRPLVTFSFKYRSLDILRANGIAPPQLPKKRRASKSPERDDEADADDAKEAKKERMNALSPKRAKKGTTTDSSASSTSIKNEQASVKSEPPQA